jgi:hypothetical protein
MRWTDVPIHFVDFEGNLTSGILEYGVVTVQGGTVRSAITRLCGPVGRIREADTAIHGLDASRVGACAPFREDFDRFALLRASGPLGAHFAHAENTLIKAAWPYARSSTDFSRPDHKTADWGPWVDTGRIYGQVFPTAPSGQLEQLVHVFQLTSRLEALAGEHCPADRRHYHAALFDALAAALLLLSLGERPDFQAMTIPWLLQLSTLNPEKRAALQQDSLDLSE